MPGPLSLVASLGNAIARAGISGLFRVNVSRYRHPRRGDPQGDPVRGPPAQL